MCPRYCVGASIRRTEVRKNDLTAEELTSFLRPVYDDGPVPPEELAKYEMCANCNLVRYEHGPNGECLFDSTTFVVKITKKKPRVHPTKAHADAADPCEDD